MSWAPRQPFTCLLGPGDSTKTTILDALELVLSPRWSVQFSDNDFYNADPSEPLTIRATVGDLAPELISDAKFGHDTRGWSSTGELHDEPEDEDALVLSVQLRVDASLEPTWTVINDRLPDGKPIRAKDRERIGCARVGAYVDRQLSWSRGTVLAKLTVAADGIGGVLAAAGRATRQAVDPTNLPELAAAALLAQGLAGALGVRARSTFQPHLDVDAASIGIGALALHDGVIPTRAAGLGSARLVAMALQLEAAKAGGVTLVDEVEHALEPHRLRRLLRILQQQIEGPTLLTTHSRLVLEELPASSLAVVRNVAGLTEVRPVPAELQPIVRSCSEALLARKVVVCEGPTELGLLKAFDDWWSMTSNSFGLLGVALANGGGSSAPGRAMGIRTLGYTTAFFADSDRELTPSEAELEAEGVGVFQWSEGLAVEQQILKDLPWEGVVEVVRYAMDEVFDPPTVRDNVASLVSGTKPTLTDDPDGWRDVLSEAVLRSAIGQAAKRGKGWFKRADLAEGLGRIVIKHWDGLTGTNTRSTFESLRAWMQMDG